MRKDPRAGFSLVELVIAMSLVSMVLLSLVSISTSMVRYQMEGIRKGAVTGGSLMSSSKITRDIQDANVLVWPNTATTTADTLIVCHNWSRVTGARLNTEAGPAGTNAHYVSVIYHCLDTGGSPARNLLRRYVSKGTGVSCPGTSPTIPACDGSGSWSENDIVASNVYKLSGSPLFSRAAGVPSGQVWVRYVIGDISGSEKYKMPVFNRFDFRVGAQRNTGSTDD